MKNIFNTWRFMIFLPFLFIYFNNKLSSIIVTSISLITLLEIAGVILFAYFIYKIRRITFSIEETMKLIYSVKIIDLVLIGIIIILSFFKLNYLNEFKALQVTFLFAVISCIANSGYLNHENSKV